MISLQTVLRSAWNYRHINTGSYGVIPPLSKPWTSLPPILDLLIFLHEETAALLDTDTSNSQQNTHLLKDHLSQLTAAAFNCFQERLNYLNRYVLIIQSLYIFIHFKALMLAEILALIPRRGISRKDSNKYAFLFYRHLVSNLFISGGSFQHLMCYF